MSQPHYAGSYAWQSSPHIRQGDTVPAIMYTVVAALIPATAGAVVFFGVDALRVVALALFSTLATEFVFLKTRRKDPSALRDGSAVITGLLLALTLPPGLKSSYVVIGGVVSIALGKQIFGGLGCNIFNPALVGRAFLQGAFPVAMTTWSTALAKVDATTAATPLGGFKFAHIVPALKPMIVGNIGGCLGETSALLILLGGLILVFRRCLDWKIPLTILATVGLVSSGYYLLNPTTAASPLVHLFGGGLLFGAVFMATDMVTSPITPIGTLVYAFGIGLLVFVIRVFGGLPEGVMYSILIMNSVVPLLNRFTRPRPFGPRQEAA